MITKEYLDMRLAELKADLIKWVIAICAGQAALIIAMMKLIK